MGIVYGIPYAIAINRGATILQHLLASAAAQTSNCSWRLHTGAPNRIGDLRFTLYGDVRALSACMAQLPVPLIFVPGALPLRYLCKKSQYHQLHWHVWPRHMPERNQPVETKPLSHQPCLRGTITNPRFG